MPGQIKIINDALPVLNLPETGVVVLVPSVGGVQFAPGMSLATALAAHQGQIIASAKICARAEADLADVVNWLTENMAYAKPERKEAKADLTEEFKEISSLSRAGQGE